MSRRNVFYSFLPTFLYRFLKSRRNVFYRFLEWAGGTFFIVSYPRLWVMLGTRVIRTFPIRFLDVSYTFPSARPWTSDPDFPWKRFFRVSSNQAATFFHRFRRTLFYSFLADEMASWWVNCGNYKKTLWTFPRATKLINKSKARSGIFPKSAWIF